MPGIDRGDPADGRMVCKGTEDHQRRFHGTGAAGAVPSAFGPARHKGTGDRAASGGKPGLEAGCDSEWDIPWSLHPCQPGIRRNSWRFSGRKRGRGARPSGKDSGIVCRDPFL